MRRSTNEGSQEMKKSSNDSEQHRAEGKVCRGGQHVARGERASAQRMERNGVQRTLASCSMVPGELRHEPPHLSRLSGYNRAQNSQMAEGSWIGSTCRRARAIRASASAFEETMLSSMTVVSTEDQCANVSGSSSAHATRLVVLASQPLESLNFNLKAIMALIDQLQFEAQPREVTTARRGLSCKW